jgi:DNA-binding MarR family transcriptional regulator/GNAT superfamily N-acetyltransferase
MPGSSTDIEAIRSFNRFYTQKIGVLHEGLLDSRFSLTEARVLYELAQRESASASDLSESLKLDPGYLSRILMRFEKHRYLARKVAETDGRRRELTLTALGRRNFATLDEHSREDLARLTNALTVEQRRDLVTAMQTIQTVLEPAASVSTPVILRSHKPGDMGWVVQRHGELYAREYGWNEDFEALVAQITAEFIRNLDPARERCWIAERGGCKVGSIFLVSKSATVAKLRLLLVEPDARGLGLGRKLVDECIRFARERGYRKVALWTQSSLVAARHIYAATGFELVGKERHHSFGHKLVAETWELKL